MRTLHPFRGCAGAAAFVAVAATWLYGCAPWVKFTPSGDTPERPPKQPQQVKLHFDLDEPKCKYRIVGLYESGESGPDTGRFAGEMQIEPIRVDAARRGFDGVMGLGCAAAKHADDINPASFGFDRMP